MSSSEDRIIAKLDNIVKQVDKRLTLLEKKIDRMEAFLEVQSSSTKRLNKHIDFVEGKYNTIRNPLQYICNRVSSLGGSSADEPLSLPPSSSEK